MAIFDIQLRDNRVNLPFDSDADTFCTNFGITDNAIKANINFLVKALKFYGLWSLADAIYPIAGGTAATHKGNLKNPLDTDAAFRMTFFGGWTHAATGMTPNGTTGYANTHYTPSVQRSNGFMSAGAYSRTNIDSDTPLFSANSNFNGQFTEITPRAFNAAYLATSSATHVQIACTDSRGWFLTSREGSTDMWGQVDQTQLGSSYATAVPTVSIYFGARNVNGSSVDRYSTREIAFGWFGAPLTEAQGLTLRRIVQAYQTRMGRQIGTADYMYELDAFELALYVMGGTSARWNFTKTPYAVAGNNNMVAGPTVGNLSQTDPATGWTLITNGGEWEPYLGSFQALNNGEGGSSAGSPTYTTFSAEELQGGFLQAGHTTESGGKYPFEFTNLPAGTYKLYLIGSIKSTINGNVPNGRFKVKFGSAAPTTQGIAQQSNYTTPALVFEGTIAEGEKIEFGPYTLTESNGDATICNCLLIEKIETTNITKNPGIGQVVITGIAPAISNPRLVNPGIGAVAVTGIVPGIAQSQVLSPGIGDVLVTGIAPLLSRAITPGIGAVQVTGLAPALIRAITPGIGEVAVGGISPSLILGVSPGAGSVLLTGIAPGISISDNKILNPGLSQIAITGLVPVIDKALAPGIGSIVVGGISPALGLSITPGAAAVIVTGLAPTVGLPGSINPGIAQVLVSGLNPGISVTNNVYVYPGISSILLDGYAPALDLLINPGPSGILVDGIAPLIILPRIIEPGLSQILITGIQPGVTVVPFGAKIKVWDGVQFKSGLLKVWRDGQFKDGTLWRYMGDGNFQ
jgi:hypothetical protein